MEKTSHSHCDIRIMERSFAIHAHFELLQNSNSKFAGRELGEKDQRVVHITCCFSQSAPRSQPTKHPCPLGEHSMAHRYHPSTLPCQHHTHNPPLQLRNPAQKNHTLLCNNTYQAAHLSLVKYSQTTCHRRRVSRTTLHTSHLTR